MGELVTDLHLRGCGRWDTSCEEIAGSSDSYHGFKRFILYGRFPAARLAHSVVDRAHSFNDFIGS